MMIKSIPDEMRSQVKNKNGKQVGHMKRCKTRFNRR